MTLKSCIRNGGYYHLKNGKKPIVFSKCIFSAICSNCKNLFFTVVPKQYACSHHCGLVLSRGNGKFINCFNCRKPIWKTQNRIKAHEIFCCSQKCLVKFHRGTNHSNYKPNGYNAKGYNVMTIDGKQVFQHRYVMEKHLNRKLLRAEIVHDINHVKSDNRISNLMIMSPHEHLIHHNPPKIRLA